MATGNQVRMFLKVGHFVWRHRGPVLAGVSAVALMAGKGTWDTIKSLRT
jgi:hypothetical protein